jgi:hypothetical protein
MDDTNENGWEVRQDETPDRLIFNTIGDEYVGLFLGIVTITPEDTEEEPFQQVLLRDDDSPKAINAGYKLLQAFAKVRTGEEVKVKYVKDIDVKQASAMKDFKVWARPCRPEWQAWAKEALSSWVSGPDNPANYANNQG